MWDQEPVVGRGNRSLERPVRSLEGNRMPSQLPDLSKPGFMDLFRGFSTPFRALKMLFSTPRLRVYTLLIAGVSAVTLVGLAVGLWFGVPALIDLFWTRPESWYGATAHVLLTILIYALLFIGGANVLPMTLAAPLMDPISIETERALGFQVADEGGFGRMVKEIVQAILNSLPHDADGAPCGWRIDLYSHWSQWWMTNANPRLPEPNRALTCKRYEIDPVLHQTDGLYLDSVSLHVGSYLNFRREHMAAAEFHHGGRDPAAGIEDIRAAIVKQTALPEGEERGDDTGDRAEPLPFPPDPQ